MKKRMLITGLLIGILCLPVIAQTTPVPIVNPSFEVETAPIADGEWSYSIPGWLNVGQTTWDPRSSAYPSGVPDGDNVAAIWTGFWIKQVLGHILMPDTELTLNVDIGWRNGYSAPDYEIQLLVGNNILASDSSADLVKGGFVTAGLSYLVTDDNPYVGQPLAVKLLGVPVGGIKSQVSFDNVRLTNDRINNNNHIVPEPSSFLLVASGVAGLGYFLRRRS